MAVKTAVDIVKTLQTMFPENKTDEMLQVVEDITDSVNGDPTAANRIAELEAKVTETENIWRKKYMDRFSGVETPPPPNTPPQDPPAPKEPETYEDLFEFS